MAALEAVQLADEVASEGRRDELEPEVVCEKLGLVGGPFTRYVFLFRLLMGVWRDVMV